MYYAAYMKANWWTLLVSGLVSVIFGALFIALPEFFFSLFTLLFGILALVTGLTFVVGALANRKYTDHFWSTLIFGIVALVVGISTFLPGIRVNQYLLPLLIAFYVLLFGLVFVMIGWELRKEIKGEWLMILIGVLALIFAFWIVFNLSEAGGVIVTVFGVFALISGVLDMIASLKVKNLDVGEYA